MQNQLCCPNCGNENLQITTATTTTTTGKNFSASKGCCGYMLLGPLGILCGACGKGATTTSTTTMSWACPKCGTIFRRPEDIRAEIEQQEKSASLLKVLAIIFGIIAALCLIFLGGEQSFVIWVSVLAAPLLFIIGYFGLKKHTESLEDELYYVTSRMAAHGNIRPTYTYQTTQSAAAKCPNCGTSLNMSAKFCTSCGHSVPDIRNVLVCKTCGGQNDLDATTCRLCGGNQLQTGTQALKQPQKPGYCPHCGKSYDMQKYSMFCPHCNGKL